MTVYLNRIFIFFLILMSMISLSYSINIPNACGVSFSDPQFRVEDKNGDSVLIVDDQGDVFVLGRNVGDSDVDSLSVEIENMKFNSEFRDLASIRQLTSLSSQDTGILFQSSTGENVTRFYDRTIETMGYGVYQNSQAACLSDGFYCNGAILENRDYYCDIKGNLDADCEKRVLSSLNCLAVSTTETDGGNRPFTAGSIFDTNSCSGPNPSSSCAGVSYSDFCEDSKILTEYYAQGSSYRVRTGVNCESEPGAVGRYCVGSAVYEQVNNCAGGECTRDAEFRYSCSSAPTDFTTITCNSATEASITTTSHTNTCGNLNPGTPFSGVDCGYSTSSSSTTETCESNEVCIAGVGCAANTAPTSCSFIVSPNSAVDSYKPTISFSFSDPDTGGDDWTCEIDFGDGTSRTITDCVPGSTTLNPSDIPTYGTGDYTAKLTVTDAVGGTCSETETISVSANRPPEIDYFSVSTMIGNPTANFRFEANDPDGDSLTCTIDFGDGNSWSDDCFSGVRVDNILHDYPVGSYTATLTVTAEGGSDTETEVVAANLGPVTGTLNPKGSGPYEFSVGEQIFFDFSIDSPYSPSSHSCLLYPTETSSFTDYIDMYSGADCYNGQVNIEHVYNSPGTFRAVLEVTVGTQVYEILSDPITIGTATNPMPTGSLTVKGGATTISPNEPVTFEYTGSDSESYSCWFDEDISAGSGFSEVTPCSSIAREVGPYTTYSDIRTYTARLEVRSSSGQTIQRDAGITVVPIGVNSAPTGSLNALNSPALVGEVVSFSYSASDVDGDSLSCSFDFDGDNIVDKIVNPCTPSQNEDYTYSSAQMYTASMTISDGTTSREFPTSVVINQEVVGNQKPTAELRATSATTIEMGQSVSFQYKATDPDGDSPLSCEVVLSGSLTENEDNCQVGWKTTSATYSSAGTYTVSNTASDGALSSDPATVTVTVTDSPPPPVNPIAGISVSGTGVSRTLEGTINPGTYQPSDFECRLQDDYNGVLISWKSCVDSFTATKTYREGTHTGEFSIRGPLPSLSIIDGSDVVFTVVEPNKDPKVIQFGVNPNEIEEGEEVTFSYTAFDSDNGDAVCTIYHGDGTSQLGTCRNGVEFAYHTYNTQGEYDAYLSITGGGVTKESVTRRITVNEPAVRVNPSISISVSGTGTSRTLDGNIVSTGDYALSDLECALRNGKPPVEGAGIGWTQCNSDNFLRTYTYNPGSYIAEFEIRESGTTSILDVADRDFTIIAPPLASCTFNILNAQGNIVDTVTLSHGESYSSSLYESPLVTSGSCSSTTVTCSDGSLSSPYRYNSCNVQTPDPCRGFYDNPPEPRSCGCGDNGIQEPYCVNGGTFWTSCSIGACDTTPSGKWSDVEPRFTDADWNTCTYNDYSPVGKKTVGSSCSPIHVEGVVDNSHDVIQVESCQAYICEGLTFDQCNNEAPAGFCNWAGSLCESTLVPEMFGERKRESTQYCVSDASWQTGAWSDCYLGGACDPGGSYSGRQYRSVYCEDSDGNVVPDSHCGGGKPSSERSCSGDYSCAGTTVFCECATNGGQYYAGDATCFANSGWTFSETYGPFSQCP